MQQQSQPQLDAIRAGTPITGTTSGTISNSRANTASSVQTTATNTTFGTTTNVGTGVGPLTQQSSKNPLLPVGSTLSDKGLDNLNNLSLGEEDENEEDDDEHRVVETDPTGRYERYGKCLGRGAYKEVYMAFDTEEGVEVAWNQLRLDISSMKVEAPRIVSEIRILESLRNENIINLYYTWVAKVNGKDRIFFITELMTSGTLRTYIKKTKGPLKLKVLKNWCRQILSGLNYLHTRTPPIIHRDLKCDNIFINGNNGQAKIGDLGLAVAKVRDHVSSVLGTPEFMAPELYDEKYDEKVDIYAFGLMILEILTKEYPYSECANQAQIYKKVSSGVKPLALLRVLDDNVRDFITTCIQFNPEDRPSAQQLLNDPFLDPNSTPVGTIVQVASAPAKGDESQQRTGSKVFQSSAHPSQGQLSMSNFSGSSENLNEYTTETMRVNPKNTYISPGHTFEVQKRPKMALTSSPLRRSNTVQSSASSASLDPSIRCKVEIVDRTSSDECQLKMLYAVSLDKPGQEVKFPFNIRQDTAKNVVDEMVREGIIEEADGLAAVLELERVVNEFMIMKNTSQSDQMTQNQFSSDVENASLMSSETPVDIVRPNSSFGMSSNTAQNSARVIEDNLISPMLNSLPSRTTAVNSTQVSQPVSIPSSSYTQITSPIVPQLNQPNPSFSNSDVGPTSSKLHDVGVIPTIYGTSPGLSEYSIPASTIMSTGRSPSQPSDDVVETPILQHLSPQQQSAHPSLSRTHSITSSIHGSMVSTGTVQLGSMSDLSTANQQSQPQSQQQQQPSLQQQQPPHQQQQQLQQLQTQQQQQQQQPRKIAGPSVAVDPYVTSGFATMSSSSSVSSFTPIISPADVNNVGKNPFNTMAGYSPYRQQESQVLPQAQQQPQQQQNQPGLDFQSSSIMTSGLSSHVPSSTVPPRALSAQALSVQGTGVTSTSSGQPLYRPVTGGTSYIPTEPGSEGYPPHLTIHGSLTGTSIGSGTSTFSTANGSNTSQGPFLTTIVASPVQRTLSVSGISPTTTNTNSAAQRTQSVSGAGNINKTSASLINNKVFPVMTTDVSQGVQTTSSDSSFSVDTSSSSSSSTSSPSSSSRSLNDEEESSVYETGSNLSSNPSNFTMAAGGANTLGGLGGVPRSPTRKHHQFVVEGAFSKSNHPRRASTFSGANNNLANRTPRPAAPAHGASHSESFQELGNIGRGTASVTSGYSDSDPKSKGSSVFATPIISGRKNSLNELVGITQAMMASAMSSPTGNGNGVPVSTSTNNPMSDSATVSGMATPNIHNISSTTTASASTAAALARGVDVNLRQRLMTTSNSMSSSPSVSSLPITIHSGTKLADLFNAGISAEAISQALRTGTDRTDRGAVEQRLHELQEINLKGFGSSSASFASSHQQQQQQPQQPAQSQQQQQPLHHTNSVSSTHAVSQQNSQVPLSVQQSMVSEVGTPNLGSRPVGLSETSLSQASIAGIPPHSSGPVSSAGSAPSLRKMASTGAGLGSASVQPMGTIWSQPSSLVSLSTQPSGATLEGNQQQSIPKQ